MRLIRCLVAWALVFFVFSSFSPGLAQSEAVTERIKGANRFLTAVEISKTGWDTAETVILARSDHYADALAGVSLAYDLNAPILLTQTKQLHTNTLSEISRLKATKIIILGGTSAISSTTEQQLNDEGLFVERIGGANRYETAANIARRISKTWSDTAVVVYSHDFTDALIAAPYAARMGYPVLLTNSSLLAKETSAVINELGISKSIVLGNEDIISNAVINNLPGAVRVSNPKYSNNSVPAAQHFGFTSNIAFIATSADFADAMTGAVLAAKRGSAIFMVGQTVPPEVTEFVQYQVNTFSIFGGSNAVSDQVENELGTPENSLPGEATLVLDRTSLEMYVSDTVQLHATITPASTTPVSWLSSNQSVLNVNSSGVITPVKAGTATVTATINGKTAECTVVVRYESPLSTGTYNIVASNGLYLNAYSSAASAFPYGLVVATSDGSPEQKVVPQVQADGSYTLKVLRNSGMNIYAKNGVSSGKTLYVDSLSNTAFVITKHSSGKYIIACKDNPDLVLTVSSDKPYSSYAHYYVKLTSYTGAANQLWTFKPVESTPAATSLTFPIDVKDSSIGDNSGIIDASAVTGITYGGKVSYYTNGGEDYTSGHYGTNYRAVDINFAYDLGKSVYSIADGIVVNIDSSYGTVFIKHTVPLTLYDGSRTYHTWYSIYAHMSPINVQVNQTVKKGAVIGKLSNAGTKDPHLHFAITTRLYNGISGFHYAYKHPGAQDLATLKEYSNATISPYWLTGSFRNILYKPFSTDIADASALNRILSNTSSAPPSN